MADPRFSIAEDIAEFVFEFKRITPCKDCGKTFDPVCMDFDHLPQFEKIGDVSRMIGRRPKEIIFQEMAKCDLVCACCHRLRTQRRSGKIVSSNRATYLLPWDSSLALELELSVDDNQISLQSEKFHNIGHHGQPVKTL